MIGPETTGSRPDAVLWGITSAPTAPVAAPGRAPVPLAAPGRGPAGDGRGPAGGAEGAPDGLASATLIAAVLTAAEMSAGVAATASPLMRPTLSPVMLARRRGVSVRISLPTFTA